MIKDTNNNFLFIFFNLFIILLLETIQNLFNLSLPNNWLIFLSIVVFTYLLIKKKI